MKQLKTLDTTKVAVFARVSPDNRAWLEKMAKCQHVTLSKLIDTIFGFMRVNGLQILEQKCSEKGR